MHKYPHHILRQDNDGNLSPAEFILVQGRWPNKMSDIWKMDSLKAVLVRVGPTRERSAKNWASLGWSVRSRQVSHAELGGVTTGFLGVKLPRLQAHKLISLR